MELNLFNIENTISNIEKEINDENLKHKEKIKELNKKMKDFVELKNLIINGVGIGKYMNAKKFIYIEGYDNIGYGDTISKLKEFKNDICKKNFKIKKEYYGCKNYDRFTLQGVNLPYGYSPDHGYVIFKICATKEWRNNEIEPNENDLSDILYFINLALKNKLTKC